MNEAQWEAFCELTNFSKSVIYIDATLFVGLLVSFPFASDDARTLPIWVAALVVVLLSALLAGATDYACAKRN
ncbi:hypothetical protein [Halococcus agarilyticus]|uniref:hypothetical protein n=1 Tax=Halococcus agarilyticus TaxID=1232219 RepID=UPI0006781B8E|nr:hypothetical protein [Halococcus agarilyticus]